MKLRQYLDTYRLETLTALGSFCGAPYTITTKARLADFITQTMLSPERLADQWQQLTDLGRQAVSYALYNEGEFAAEAFAAQYGELPDQNLLQFWSGRAVDRLGLFLYGQRLPDDLMPLLRPLTTRPEPFRISGMIEPPQEVEGIDRDMEPLRADTEQTGQADLATLLSLIERREIAFSETSGLPTPAGGTRLLQALAAGDFLEAPAKTKLTDTIRPVGLCMFARLGGLIEWSRLGEMALTDAGRAWLQSQKPELLLEAFERWQHAGGGDEIQRIGGLHNRRSKRIVFTSPVLRRERIVEALSWCPAGEWIDIDDFFRGIRAWQLDFAVEDGGEALLYVGPSYANEYGWAFDYWRVVNGLYILAVLWETLATIGALDILYLAPGDAFCNIDSDYDIEGPFSLYDGLAYFRINALGAYLFGQARSYTPAMATRPAFLAADTGVIRVTAPEHATPADRLMLASFTTPVDADTYRFDLDGLLGALEEKADLTAARAFLARWLADGLPTKMDGLFETALARSQAFTASEPAFTVKTRDRDLAVLVAQDPKLKAFCRLAGDRTIVLPRSRLAALRKRLRELGYVLLD